MEIEIRPVRKEDFGELILLFKEFATFEKQPGKVTNSEALMLEEEAYFNGFLALNKGKIVGYATWFFAYYSWSGKSLYMDDLYVKKDFRKQGIGKKLLETVIKFAKDNNCKKVRWQVSNWNTNAQEFYKLIGAEISSGEWNCDLWLNRDYHE